MLTDGEGEIGRRVLDLVANGNLNSLNQTSLETYSLPSLERHSYPL